MSTLVKYETDNGEVALSTDVIRDYLVAADVKGKVTLQELTLFLKLCQFQKLNPFLREAYLIKYKDNPATMVTGKEVFTKRAARNGRFDGFEAGIVVVKDGVMAHREGALVLAGETLIGGWARVYLKNTRVPMYGEAAIAEYGKAYGNWKSIPATMIRKVALVQALREAFPEDLGGLYDAAEMRQVDDENLPTEPVPVAVADGTPEEPLQGEVVDEDTAPATAPQSAPRAHEEPMTLPLAKAMAFPAGKAGGKYPELMLAEVVEADPAYVEKVIRLSKNTRLVAALILLRDEDVEEVTM